MTTKWEICCNCDGEGKHSKHLGGITSRELEQDWDEDELADYMNGAYDTVCSVCRGTGKVKAEDNREEKYYATDQEYYWKREGGY